MKKLFFIIFCIFFSQNIFAQVAEDDTLPMYVPLFKPSKIIYRVAQYNTLYLLFDPVSTPSNATQTKSIEFRVPNNDGTRRLETVYEFGPKLINGKLESNGFYDRLYVTINHTNFITIPLSQLSNYPVKTIDQVRQEAHPSNKYDFYNEAYYEPILHYYIVEKDISAGTAKIVKVFPIVMPKY